MLISLSVYEKPAEFLIINMQNYSKIIQLTNNYIKQSHFYYIFLLFTLLALNIPTLVEQTPHLS